MKTEVKKLEKSQIEVKFELTVEEFAKHFDKAIFNLKGHVKMDGFRKGHAPSNIVEEKIGKENLLMEAGDLAVKDAYPKFIEENKLEPIGESEVEVIKIAKGSPFEFKLKISVLPEITLPNYQEIAGKIKVGEVLVDEKELQETLDYLQKSRAKFTVKDTLAEPKDFVEIEYSTPDLNGGKVLRDRFILGQGGFLKDFEDNVIGMKTGQEKEFTAKFPENTPREDLAGKPAIFKVKMLSVQNMELAEINDEFAKSLGSFDTLVALKDNLKEGIALEKKESEKQRARGEMLEKISAKINFDLPEKMVTYEKERLFEDLKIQVDNQFKIPFEQYLSSVKKTEEEIKSSFKIEAEKRIKNFLVLRQIGKAENIEITEAQIMEELPKLMQNYTQEQLSQIDIGQLKEYSKGAIFNEKVFEKLESFSKI